MTIPVRYKTNPYARPRSGAAPRRPAWTRQPGAGAGNTAAIRTRMHVLRDRVRWTLVFSAFFAFAGGVVANRLAIGQPVMALGLIGVLMQTEEMRFGPVPTMLAVWTAWSALGYFASPYPDSVADALRAAREAVCHLVCRGQRVADAWADTSVLHLSPVRVPALPGEAERF